MKITVMDTLSETMAANRKDGYTADFKLEEQGLCCSENGKVYAPDQLCIVAHYRFEGTSDPQDMAAIYLVESTDGIKGLVVDAFGTYSDGDLSAFLKQVPMEEDGS